MPAFHNVSLQVRRFILSPDAVLRVAFCRMDFYAETLRSATRGVLDLHGLRETRTSLDFLPPTNIIYFTLDFAGVACNNISRAENVIVQNAFTRHSSYIDRLFRSFRQTNSLVKARFQFPSAFLRNIFTA